MAATRAGSAGLGRWLKAPWVSPFGLHTPAIVTRDLWALPELAETGRADVHAQGGGD